MPAQLVLHQLQQRRRAGTRPTSRVAPPPDTVPTTASQRGDVPVACCSHESATCQHRKCAAPLTLQPALLARVSPLAARVLRFGVAARGFAAHAARVKSRCSWRWPPTLQPWSPHLLSELTSASCSADGRASSAPACARRSCDAESHLERRAEGAQRGLNCSPLQSTVVAEHARRACRRVPATRRCLRSVRWRGALHTPPTCTAAAVVTLTPVH